MHMECIRDLYEGIRNAYEKHHICTWNSEDIYLKFIRTTSEMHPE